MKTYYTSMEVKTRAGGVFWVSHCENDFFFSYNGILLFFLRTYHLIVITHFLWNLHLLLVLALSDKMIIRFWWSKITAALCVFYTCKYFISAIP